MDWNDDESFDGLGSDVEQVSMHQAESGHLYNDYLLGLKILECSLMKRTFDDARPTLDECDLTVAYAYEFSHFPYQDCLRRLAGVLDDRDGINWRASAGNHCATLASLLGATYRICPDEHAEVLLIVESMRRDQSQGHEPFQASTRTDHVERHAKEGKINFDGTEHLPQFAVKLHEYVQSQGFRIKWDETVLSFDPPKFRAATRIHGRTFEGMASSKKTARHLAAKQACVRLQILNT